MIFLKSGRYYRKHAPLKRTFSPIIVNRWRDAVKRVLSMDDPWKGFHLEELDEERAIRHRYSAVTKKWVTDTIHVKMQREVGLVYIRIYDLT